MTEPPIALHRAYHGAEDTDGDADIGAEAGFDIDTDADINHPCDPDTHPSASGDRRTGVPSYPAIIRKIALTGKISDAAVHSSDLRQRTNISTSPTGKASFSKTERIDHEPVLQTLPDLDALICNVPKEYEIFRYGISDAQIRNDDGRAGLKDNFCCVEIDIGKRLTSQNDWASGTSDEERQAPTDKPAPGMEHELDSEERRSPVEAQFAPADNVFAEDEGDDFADTSWLATLDIYTKMFRPMRPSSENADCEDLICDESSNWLQFFATGRKTGDEEVAFPNMYRQRQMTDCTECGDGRKDGSLETFADLFSFRDFESLKIRAQLRAFCNLQAQYERKCMRFEHDSAQSRDTALKRTLEQRYGLLADVQMEQHDLPYESIDRRRGQLQPHMHCVFGN